VTISQDLTYAILALDSYNRGYGEGVIGLDGLGSDIANYTIIDQSDTEDGSAGVAASFYAVAYRDASDYIVISYRGTDDPAGDIPGWMGGGGFQTEQVELAAQFYYQVRRDYPEANIVLAGHSLGGGLAGLVAELTGSTAYIFDNRPFQQRAARVRDVTHPAPNLSGWLIS
jgi:pimeloyl-ACP methyl ester carboxylesterase